MLRPSGKNASSLERTSVTRSKTALNFLGYLLGRQYLRTREQRRFGRFVGAEKERWKGGGEIIVHIDVITRPIVRELGIMVGASRLVAHVTRLLGKYGKSLSSIVYVTRLLGEYVQEYDVSSLRTYLVRNLAFFANKEQVGIHM